MRIKSYFANTVESAVALAREELGREALLISVQRSTAEAKPLGEYEVVFGLASPGKTEGAGPGDLIPVERERGDTPSAPDLAMDRRMDDFHRSLEETRRVITHSVGLIASHALSSSAAGVFAMLMDAGLSPGLASEISSTVLARHAHPAVARTRGSQSLDFNDIDLIREALESRLQVAPGIEARSGGARAVMLVGPRGSGKTTTLMKLAAVYGLEAGLKVHVISLDCDRIGSLETLRTYSSLMDLSLHVISEAGLLSHAVSELADETTLVLVDTPGFSGAELKSSASVIAALSEARGVETHLVLPAWMGVSNLARVSDRFAALKPAKVIVTGVDEAGSLGAIYSEAVRIQRPISFLCSGPLIPDDITPATREAVVGRILPRPAEQVLSAA